MQQIRNVHENHDSVIKKLIEIGKVTDNSEYLKDIKPWGIINRQGKAFWQDISRSMETDNLVFLIKGLTLAEKTHHWIGGSVAGSVWLYKILEKKSSVLAEDVATWVLQNSENPYLPYGTMNTHGARTHKEYKERDASYRLNH